jgi:hypothetical protein
MVPFFLIEGEIQPRLFVVLCPAIRKPWGGARDAGRENNPSKGA